MKAALIDDQNNVLNVIVWDSTCKEPKGTTAIIIEDDVIVSPKWTFDKINNRFIPPQPYSSWTFNVDTYSWEAPIPKPDVENFYIWDEGSGDWKIS